VSVSLQFFGELPMGIGNLTALQSLSLTFNLLSGTIPGSISRLTKLT
jgi:hypothetical protein